MHAGKQDGEKKQIGRWKQQTNQVTQRWKSTAKLLFITKRVSKHLGCLSSSKHPVHQVEQETNMTTNLFAQNSKSLISCSYNATKQRYLQNPSNNNQSLICAFDPARLIENRYRKADKRSALHFQPICQTQRTFFSKSCRRE